MGPCFDKTLQTVVTTTTTTGAGFHGNKDSDIYILLKLVCDTTIEGFFIIIWEEFQGTSGHFLLFLVRHFLQLTEGKNKFLGLFICELFSF